MAEPAVTETPHGLPDAVVVDQANWDAHVDQQLGQDGPEGGQGEDTIKSAEDSTPAPTVIQPKEGDEEGSRVFFRGKWVDKSNYAYRLDKNTKEATKEAEERATKAEAARKAADEARAKAEQEAQSLRLKYEPPRSDELGPEPKPEQFKDVAEYSKALKDWTAQATRLEDQQKAQAEKRANDWESRKKAAREAIPDFDEVINSAASIQISAELRDAILDSEVGPQVLHHLAKNQDVAAELGKMTVGGMLRALGRIEAQLQAKPEPKPTKEEVKQTPQAQPPAQISRAPEPIKPIGGNSASVIELKGSDAVPANMSYDDWKKHRMAGRIK